MCTKSDIGDANKYSRKFGGPIRDLLLAQKSNAKNAAAFCAAAYLKQYGGGVKENTNKQKKRATRFLEFLHFSLARSLHHSPTPHVEVLRV